MPKPRIIILMHYLELGGAEMALLGLLSALDPARVDVDLFVYSHQGPLMAFVPRWVNVLPENRAYKCIEQPLKQVLQWGRADIVSARLLAKLRHRRWLAKNPPEGDDGSVFQFVADCVTPMLPKINPDVEYDLCISFLTPHNYGLEKVRAKRRLAWIHTDYSTVWVNRTRELPVWDGYDNIVSISPDVTRSFIKTFPSLAPKIMEMENILPKDYILKRAQEGKVLTDSRLSGGAALALDRTLCSSEKL